MMPFVSIKLSIFSKVLIVVLMKPLSRPRKVKVGFKIALLEVLPTPKSLLLGYEATFLSNCTGTLE
jgi:hypothetical protein